MDRDQEILDYLQNRQSPDARDAFDAAMQRDPSLAAEVDVMRRVRAELAAGPKHADPDAGWARLSAEIDAQSAAGPSAANANRAPWLHVLKYAAVAALAIVTWQVTLGPRLADGPGGFRTASEDTAAYSFQVRFAETATLGEIAALIGPLGGTITDGPTALGLVRLSFADSDQRDAARRMLEDRSDLVEFVAE